MLYVLTIYMTKIASLQFQNRLARPSGLNRLNIRRKSVKYTMLSVAAWTIIALLVLSFQCALPHPWVQPPARCIDQLAFWITNGVVDTTTQLFIGLIPIYLLFNLQLSMNHKRIASMSFTPSLLTIPLAILRLTYLANTHHSSTTAGNSVKVALVTVIHTNYSVIAGSLTFLKPVVDSLDIGLMKNDIRIPLDSEDTNVGATRINPFSILSGRTINNPPKIQRCTWNPTSGGISSSSATATAAKDPEFQLQDLKKQHSSQDRMVIKQTKTTVVSSYPRIPEPIHTRLP